MAKILSIYESPTGATNRELYIHKINTDNQIPSASYPFRDDGNIVRENSCIIDPISGHLVVAYVDPLDNKHGVCQVYESVGESYIVGDRTKFFDSGEIRTGYNSLRIAHIPNSNKIAFVYNEDRNPGWSPGDPVNPDWLWISIGEVIYGNYESVDQWYVNMIGSPIQITPSDSPASEPTIVFDSTTNQLIIAYSNYNNKTSGNSGGTIHYRLCSIDNAGVVSFGDIGIFTVGNQPVLAYDSIAQKVVVIYFTDTFRGEAVVGTVSGTEIINVSSPKRFHTGQILCDSGQYYTAVFDPNLGKIYIAFALVSGFPSFGINNPASRLTAGKITANSISFETYFSIHWFTQLQPGISMVYDGENKVVVGTYGMFSNPNDNNSGFGSVHHARAFAARFPVDYTSLSSSSSSSSSESSSSSSLSSSSSSKSSSSSSKSSSSSSSSSSLSSSSSSSSSSTSSSSSSTSSSSSSSSLSSSSSSSSSSLSSISSSSKSSSSTSSSSTSFSSSSKSSSSSSFSLTNQGVLFLWGSNTNGELGQEDSGINRSSPVQVGSDTDWIDLDNNTHIVSIKTNGTLWSWGLNTNGQLGQNTAGISISSPVQVGSDTDWKNVNAGNGWTLAVKTDGTLWSWGLNTNGELGQNTAGISISSPVQVGSDTDWNRVVTLFSSSLAVKTDGTLWSWGRNNYGQLGQGDIISRSSPVQVGILTDWEYIDAYESVLSIKSDGTLWAWGRNTYGQLGQGDSISRSSPVQIGSDTDWSWVAVGGTDQQSAFAIKTDGTLWAWGANLSGQLGLGNVTSINSPIQVGSLTDWKKVYGFGRSTAALKSDRTLWVWGLNSVGIGELGLGNTVSRSSPVQVGSKRWQSIASYKNSVVATTVMGGIRSSSSSSVSSSSTSKSSSSTSFSFSSSSSESFFTQGALFLWGAGSQGQLAQGADKNFKNSPVQVGSNTNWTEISVQETTVAGNGWTLAIKSDGTLWAWGNNNIGQLGQSNIISRSSPVQVGTLTTNWRYVNGGRSSAGAIKTDGTLWTWGSNSSGQLGSGNVINRSSPVQVGSDTDWKKIFMDVLAMAIKTNGTLWSWGSNLYGRLGHGDNAFGKSSPVQVGSDDNWIDIAIDEHTLALKTDGTLWAWGRNNYGQLGQAVQSGDLLGNYDINYPIQLGSDTDWVAIAAGRNNSFALKSDRTLWAWGRNTEGQLGFDDIISRSSPVQVGALTDWMKIYSLSHTTAALKSDRTLWTWGNNSVGQLGLGDVVRRSSPVQVGSEKWIKMTFRYNRADATAGPNHIGGIRSSSSSSSS